MKQRNFSVMNELGKKEEISIDNSYILYVWLGCVSRK